MHLHIACNDPDNGLFCGRAEKIEIGMLEFEPKSYGKSPRLREERDCIVLSGKRWPICFSKDWVGNWCWNAYALGDAKTTETWALVPFVVWLRKRALFDLTCGTSEFWSWWHDTKVIPSADIHHMLREAYH